MTPTLVSGRIMADRLDWADRMLKTIRELPLEDREALFTDNRNIWTAVHPNLPVETKRDLIRAGSGTDFQGFMPPDPDLSPERLRHIAAYGSWGEWVVANNPYTPADLLATLAQSVDPQVRLFVARNPSTPANILAQLSKGATDDARHSERNS